MKAIIAVNQHNAIGVNNDLLEHISEDLQLFKKLTTDETVVMGWNTFKSLNRISGLPNRRNCVLTHKTQEEWAELQRNGFVGDNVERLGSWDEVIALDRENFDGVFLIGGAELYNHAISKGLVDVIFVTQINQVNPPTENVVKINHDLFNFETFNQAQEDAGIAVWWINELIEKRLYENQFVCGFVSEFVHNPETDWRGPTQNDSMYRFVTYSRLY